MELMENLALTAKTVNKVQTVTTVLPVLLERMAFEVLKERKVPANMALKESPAKTEKSVPTVLMEFKVPLDMTESLALKESMERTEISEKRDIEELEAQEESKVPLENPVLLEMLARTALTDLLANKVFVDPMVETEFPAFKDGKESKVIPEPLEHLDSLDPKAFKDTMEFPASMEDKELLVSKETLPLVVSVNLAL